jgi:pyrroline-5-carboxylate reductase
MKQDLVFTFIGGGNMAGSLIGGLISGGCRPEQFRVSDPDPQQRERLRQRVGIQATDNNQQAVTGADVVVLAVKPQAAAQALEGLGSSAPDALYISVIAGIREDQLKRWLSTGALVIRAMPNTPALLGCGVSGLHADQSISAEQREIAENVMRSSGAVIWVEEEALLDPVTAVSGSGPAYFFLLMEAMTRAGVELGLAPEAARLLTQETALGAARMALESDDDVADLRRRVTSPGGTTAAALAVLQTRNVPAAIGEAVRAACDRAGQLADEFGQA